MCALQLMCASLSLSLSARSLLVHLSCLSYCIYIMTVLVGQECCCVVSMVQLLSLLVVALYFIGVPMLGPFHGSVRVLLVLRTFVLV